MSLYGAMYSGVSALSAESSAMGAISDNISNINTVGYKNTSTNFQTLVTKQVSLTEYSPGGVQSKPRTNVNTQGLLQSTGSSTDVSISGQGFFVVNSEATPLTSGGGQFAYTRAGSFTVDKNGYLTNAASEYLQGWPLVGYDGTSTAAHQVIDGSEYMAAYKNSTGAYTYINTGVVDPTNLQPLNLDNIAGTAAATSSIQLGANLPSGATVGTTEQTNLLEYDSLGNSHNVLLNWTKSAANEWALGVTPPEGATSAVLTDAKGNPYSASGRLDFSTIPVASAQTTVVNNATGQAVAGATSVTNTTTQTAVPNSNYSMSINGTTYNFVVGSGTDGVPANYLYADPTGITSPATYAQNMTIEMKKAFESQYAGATAGAAFSSPSADGTLSIVVNGTTTNIPYSAGDSATTIVSAINANAATTGVNAWLNGGTIQYYTTNDQAVAATITDSGGNAGLEGANGPLTVTGTGLTYVQQVAGTGSIVFNQYDDAHAITVSGLTNIETATGNYALSQAYNPNTSTPTTYTVGALASQVFSGTTATANNPVAGNLTPAITFNGDGTPKAVNVGQMLITWANGSQDQTTSSTNGISPPINLFLGDTNVADGMTQLSGSYSLTYNNQNGAQFGNFSSLSVSSNGIVTAQFDNGVTRPIFQIPIATFVNPDGMSSLTGNVFLGTDESGLPTLRVPGASGSGTVNESSLEASTVDLGTEFTDMIVTQRAYSAAAKIITTANQMLDDLINVIR